MNDINQQPTLIRLKKFCRLYSRDVVETSVRAVLLLISTAVLSLVVLYFYSILWHIFRMTYSGVKFIGRHPEANDLISNMVDSDLTEISIHTTFSAFTICMIISSICRLFYITRYFYYPHSIIAKLMFWGLPLSLVVSIYTNDHFQFDHWSYTLPATIVPTLCVFTYCSKFSDTLLPEFGDVMLNLIHGLKNLFSLQPRREP